MMEYKEDHGIALANRTSLFKSLRGSALVRWGLLAALCAAPLAAQQTGEESIPGDPSIMPVEESTTADLAVGNAEIIARHRLGSGRTLVFVEAGDGYVGVLESAPIGSPSISAGLALTEGATPLEIFIATAPAGLQAPAALLEDHRLIRGDLEIRPISVAAFLSGFENWNTQDDSCGFSFVDDWKASFAGQTDYSDAAFCWECMQPNYKTFYPGGDPNRETHLGVCSRLRYATGGYWLDMLDFKIERKFGSTWSTVAGPISVYGGNRVTFVSFHPSARYRGRVRGRNGDNFPRTFGYAVAYSKALGLTG